MVLADICTVGVDLDALVAATEGYSGADIKLLCREVQSCEMIIVCKPHPPPAPLRPPYPLPPGFDGTHAQTHFAIFSRRNCRDETGGDP